VLTRDFPRERRADPRKQLHRYSQVHPDAVERYPYRSDIKALPTHRHREGIQIGLCFLANPDGVHDFQAELTERRVGAV
jgi:hypothetical protein